MRVCASCGRENPDDRDFCECGEYLRWEPTGFMAAVEAPEQAAAPDQSAPPPAAAPPPPPPPPAPDLPSTAVRPAAPAQPPPAAQPAAPAAQQPGLATMTLRVPDIDQQPGQQIAVGVDPGGRTRLLALVRNGSGIVDNYTLSVDGLPDDWYTVAPNPVYLVPYGSAGAYEQEVELHLHPPRTPEAEARVWNLKVVAHSSAYGQEAASAPFVLGIQPYEEYAPKLTPQTASGRRKAEYAVTVRNKANSAVMVALAIQDAEDVLEGDFESQQVEVPPGEARTTQLAVKPPRQIYVGRSREHRFELQSATGEAGEELLAGGVPEDDLDAEGGNGLGGKLKGKGPKVKGPRVNVSGSGVKLQQPKAAVKKPSMNKSFGLGDLKRPGGGDAPAWTSPTLPTQAVFRQKPWVPRWAAILFLLLLVAAIVVLFLLPHNVAVPDVRGKTVFDAEKALTEANLTLNPVVKEQVSSKKPGTIIDQTPKPGEKVSTNAQVSVLQAVGSGDVKVPDVVGKTFADASKAIEAAKLAVGPVAPQPPDPALKVKSTIPAAGETAKEGKAIQVFLAPKGTGKGKGKAGAGAAGAAAGGGAGGSGKADIVVPAVAGAPLDKYAAGLAKLGLVPVQKRVFSDQPKDTLFATDPPGGSKVAKGAGISLLVSDGIPQVAFDNDKDIVLVNGINGKTLETVAKSPAREQEPAFNFTGTALAFVSGGQLELSNRAKPEDPPVPLTSGADQWRLPSFAPTPSVNVLAAIKLIGNSGGGDLCIGKVDRAGFAPRCLPKPGGGIGFGNAIHWAPDGKALFAFGRTSSGKAGIYRYTTARPFSADPSDYNAPKLVTDSSAQGKYALDLAISPDGKQMAVVGNFDTGRLQVYLTRAGDFSLSKAKRLPIEACTVTWRPDSREIAIVQSDACGEPGRIARIAIKDPRRSVQLGISGNTPTYQPSPGSTG